MAPTKFDICSRALTRVGAKPIVSFDEATAEAIVAAREYEPKVQEALSAHPWRFATDQRVLNKLQDVPAGRWGFAYQAPSQVLTVHTVTLGDVPIEYDRYGDKIFTNEDGQLVIDYTFRAAEATWGTLFTAALTEELAAIFALALARDQGLHDTLYNKAEEVLWPRARLRESQQQTTRRMKSGRYIAVRAGLRARW
jgi:hypothetical protein